MRLSFFDKSVLCLITRRVKNFFYFGRILTVVRFHSYGILGEYTECIFAMTLVKQRAFSVAANIVRKK